MAEFERGWILRCLREVGEVGEEVREVGEVWQVGQVGFPLLGVKAPETLSIASAVMTTRHIAPNLPMLSGVNVAYAQGSMLGVGNIAGTSSLFISTRGLRTNAPGGGSVRPQSAAAEGSPERLQTDDPGPSRASIVRICAHVLNK